MLVKRSTSSYTTQSLEFAFFVFLEKNYLQFDLIMCLSVCVLVYVSVGACGGSARLQAVMSYPV